MTMQVDPSDIPNGWKFPLQSWGLPLLMLALVTLSGVSVALSWDGERTWRFALIALLGGLLAAFLAHTRLFDGFAILLTTICGIATIWSVTAVLGGHFEGSVWDQLRAFPQPVISALVHDEITGRNRDLTADTLLSITIWMSSWIAVWMLLRVGFVLFSLLPPVVLILANTHFADSESTWIPIIMIGLSLLIIVRFRIGAQANTWQRRRMAIGESVIGRVLITGLAITVIISSTLFVTPQAWSQTALQPLINKTIDRVEAVRLEAQYWFDDLLGTSTAPPRAGSYSDFSDGFSIGGPVTLTDQPEVMVQVDTLGAPYLKARTYDNYTGRGWNSSSAGMFADTSNSIRQSPELRYNPNWEVAVSPDGRNQREETTAQITPLVPNSDVVLSVDSFVSADIQTVVRMSWTDVTDAPMAVRINTLNTLPPDVQKLGSLLLQSELTGASTSWGPGATSGGLQAAIDEEVDDLAKRGIEVRWTATSDGIIDTLFVSGRLPVFDDVEAVFRYQSSTLTDPQYEVTGLTSVAIPDQLMAAGTEYPDWVVDRYLQTGDTVTDRTLQLTNEIIGDETNPYLQSVLIEEWLRTNIVYDDRVDAPPGDQDLVDYVLFDYRYGYCEHYSAAMTVMLRSLGVPARVAVGYSPGTWDAASNSFVYLQTNAHAWVEVYFPGYGWIPFEPTANRPLGEFNLEPSETDGGVEEVDQAEQVPTEPTIPTAEVSTPDVQQDNSAATPQPTSSIEQNQPPVVLEQEGSGGPPGWLLPTVLSTGTMAILGGGLWMLWNWSLRDLAPAEGLMRRVRRVGGWIGIRSGSTTTPREFSKRFESQAAGLSSPVKRITRAYEIETFGPRAARDSLIADARNAWFEIRRNLIRLLRKRRR